MNRSSNRIIYKEIKPVHPKGNHSWIFIGRTDAEAEAPILWPPDAKNWLIRKHPDAGKDWRPEEKGMTEDEMVRWHHQLSGREQALGDGEGQGSLACCSPWGHKESDTTEQLNNNIHFYRVSQSGTYKCRWETVFPSLHCLFPRDTSFPISVTSKITDTQALNETHLTKMFFLLKNLDSRPKWLLLKGILLSMSLTMKYSFKRGSGLKEPLFFDPGQQLLQ